MRLYSVSTINHCNNKPDYLETSSCEGAQEGEACSRCREHARICRWSRSTNSIHGGPSQEGASLSTLNQCIHEWVNMQAFPDTDIDAALDVHTATTSRESHKISLEMTTMPGATQVQPFSHSRSIDRLPFAGASVPIEDGDPEPSDDEYEYGMSPQILEKLEALSLYPLRNLWLGKSSDARLLQRAVDMKSNYSGEPREHDNLDPLSSTAKAFKQYPVRPCLLSAYLSTHQESCSGSISGTTIGTIRIIFLRMTFSTIS